MFIDQLLQTLHDLPLAAAIRENDLYFPAIETVHVAAIAVVFGSIAVVDLRLLGFAAHRRSAARLTGELLPFTWVGFALAVISGGLMFISNAPDYVANPWFLAKFVFLGLAGINMLVFHFTTYRTIADWDSGPAPARARLAGLLSILLWTLVILCGRWIAFSG